VYGVYFADVGENEFSLVNERLINAQQLKKISKAILRMGFVMGITEVLESSGAMAQQCNMEEIQTNKFPWISACVFPFICMVVVTDFWGKFQSCVKNWDDRMKGWKVIWAQSRCSWGITINTLEIWETV
jgi:hypothetical protein